MKHRIQKIALAAALLAIVPAAQAQFSDMLRSLSGALRGAGGSAAPQPQQGGNATIGIRGIDEGGTVAQAPASADNALLDGWLATRPQATQAANARGLTMRPVNFKQGGTTPTADNTNN